MKFCLLVGYFLLTCFHLFPQDNALRFRHITVQDGLSRSWVKCIHRDSIGYLWVGTADGLNRYDGNSFRIHSYKSGEPNSINNNNINVIYEDSKGNIWVGTQAGLNLYNRDKDSFTPLQTINNYISCIHEYDDGRLLIGSPGGLFLFFPTDTTAIQLYHDFGVEDILQDTNNNFWLATYEGLLLLDTIDYSYIPVTCYPQKGTDIHCLFLDSKGGLWVGTDTDGLIYLPYSENNTMDAELQTFNYDPQNPESISKGAVYSIAEDDNQNLWVGLENGGLSILNINDLKKGGGSFANLTYSPGNTNGISDNSIHYIYHDNHNTMWIGTYGNGLCYYNKLLNQFQHYRYQPDSDRTINNNRVKAIYEEDDFLWIGTEEGLNMLDKRNGVYQYFVHDHKDPYSIGSNAVLSILRDSRGYLWVGCWGGGLNKYNEHTKTFERFMFDEGNPKSIGSNNVVKIIETSDSTLWIATMRGGLNRYDYKTNTFERFQNDYIKNSISNNWVFDVMESSNGNLWISTSIAVEVLNRESNYFYSFTHNPSDSSSISYNGANTLFEDSRGNIWIGTSNGLNLYDSTNNSFTHYSTSEGLPGSMVQAIAEDSMGNLWLSTNNGVSKFVEGSVTPETPVFINYNTDNGLQGIEFNARSSFVNSNGLIYFGGNNGYNVFNPKRIESNPYPPNIVITRFLVLNKPISADNDDSPLQKDISVTEKIKLKRKHSIFTIEFAALNLLAPENNQYAYFLEGFEKGWNYVGNQRSATYTNLNPGKYSFRVKASNNDGLWNEQGVTLDIVILPAWWQSKIAMAVYVLIILLTFYYFRKNTIISVNLKNELWREHLESQKSEELYQLKNQFYVNISHELRTPLTLIIGPLKQLMSNSIFADKLDTIYRNASRLKELVDQILDFNKVESQMMKVHSTETDVVDFTQTILMNFSDYAGHKNIALLFKSNVSVCRTCIDEDKMDKILTNIISNAIKNTPDRGTVTISLTINPDKSNLKFEVEDTGCGISPEEIDHIFNRFYTPRNVLKARQGTGIGLNLTLKLIELLDGTLNASSQPNEGSIFTVNIPVRVTETRDKIIKVSFALNNKETNNTHGKSAKLSPLKHKYTILIIDDNVDICTYIESILSNEYNVVWINNSDEAFEHINMYLPDLIISDVMMPKIDGFELCGQVKSDLRFSHIPLILLTARVGVENQVTGYDAGADDYILKPFDSTILRARVRNLITQKEKIRHHFVGPDGIVNRELRTNYLDISFMEQVISMIRENFIDPEFDVNQIIERLGMSRSVFYKKFKDLSNRSINDLVRHFRLTRATELLSEGKYSVSQVAYDCGFSDPAYFSKVFKEYYKESPTRYLSKRKK